MVSSLALSTYVHERKRPQQKFSTTINTFSQTEIGGRTKMELSVLLELNSAVIYYNLLEKSLRPIYGNILLVKL